MPAHQLHDLLLIGNVNLRGTELVASDSFHYGACALHIHVRDRHAPAIRIVRQVKGRAQSHAASAEYKNLHNQIPNL
jgi:hypothetical protein